MLRESGTAPLTMAYYISTVNTNSKESAASALEFDILVLQINSFQFSSILQISEKIGNAEILYVTKR